MTSNDKKKWRERWLGSINELTSLELQTKSWLDKENTNPHWSFVEFMCSYFDDLVIDNNYEYPLHNSWITNREYEIIRDWHQALSAYDSPNNNDHDNDAILKDNTWRDILQLGIDSRHKLAETLDVAERMILTEKIDY